MRAARRVDVSPDPPLLDPALIATDCLRRAGLLRAPLFVGEDRARARAAGAPPPRDQRR